jgi:hypothetical protein
VLGLLTLALQCRALAQPSNQASPLQSAGAGDPLKGLTNMNRPNDTGAPLPAPATDGKLKLDNAVLQLCLKLQEAKANPDYCK